jgi:uncharacterized protein (TIGR03000 family)
MLARPAAAARFYRPCLGLLLALLTAPNCRAQPYAAPAAATGATVEVKLPAEAELWFDGTLTKQTGDRRTFRTPPLSPGLTFTYDVAARWRDGGQDVVRSERLLIRAGDTAVIDLTRIADRTRGPGYMGVREVGKGATAAPAAALPDHGSLVEVTVGQPPSRHAAGHMALTDVDKARRPDPPTRRVPAAGNMSIVEIDLPRR